MALASAHSLPIPPIPKSLAAPRFNPRLAVGLLVLEERLYALQIPNETALGLHLQPSDQVEIVVTTNKTRPQDAETHVVLPAVSIFSIGGSESSGAFGVSSNTDRSGLGASKTTTLVLRTDDAGYQALAKAREIGDLDLSLIGSQEPAP